MEEEMSVAMTILVELLVISAVIGSIVLFTKLGQNFSNMSVAQITDVQSAEYGSEVISLGEYGKPIPVAALYSLLVRNSQVVNQISGSAYGVTVTKAEDLTSIFNKKILSNVVRTGDYFKVTVQEAP